MFLKINFEGKTKKTKFSTEWKSFDEFNQYVAGVLN